MAARILPDLLISLRSSVVALFEGREVVVSGKAAFGSAPAESRRSPVRSSGDGLAPIADAQGCLATARKQTLYCRIPFVARWARDAMANLRRGRFWQQ